jgi:uncharacterized protein (TIGR03437 family)
MARKVGMRGLMVPAAVVVCLPACLFTFAQEPVKREASGEGRFRRQEWFKSIRAYPFGSIPPGARLAAIREMDHMLETEAESQKTSQRSIAESALRWTLIGPEPINDPFYHLSSGRVTALAVDPRDANVVYAGAAEGGVWKTIDGGQTWAPLTDDQPALSVGSLALDPSNPNTLYVGTGEANFNGDGYSGAGILKTNDGGVTWRNIREPFVGTSIGGLAVHPLDGKTVLAAGDGGIYRSNDAGETWRRVLAADVASAVIYDPIDPQNAYAGLGYFYGGSPAGIYKSSDGGVTWIALKGTGSNVLPSSNIGRVALAISPTDPSMLYAGIERSEDNGPALAFKSTDGGLNWISIPGPSYCEAQCWYNNVVQFNPTNPSILLGGGSKLFGSFDGGSTWQALGSGSIATGYLIHPDTHAIAFSRDGSRIYVGNDGGVWTTDNLSSQTATWTPLNRTFAITQFYPGISIHPSNPNIGFGGTQDNGALIFSGALQWDYIACGDGSATAIDPTTPTTVYVACADGNVGKSVSGGGIRTFHVANSGIPSSDSQLAPYLAIDPSSPQQLYYTGARHVYQTTNGAANWSAISPDLTGGLSDICVIAVAPTDSNTVYAGTCAGALWITTNASAGTASMWVSHSAGLPQRAITSIAISTTDPRIAYVTLSGFGSGHVFKTSDGGTSWANLSGNLPNIPANAIVTDPDLPGILYLATDIGLFWTTNDGRTWAVLGQGLPRVAVLDIKLHQSSRTLRAATHGRSMWDLQMPLAGLNLVPTINSLAPSSVIAGSGVQTVSISGANFTSTSIVTFGSIQLTVLFVSSSELTVSVPSSILAAPGTVSVVVTTAPPGGGTSNVVVFSVTAPPSLFVFPQVLTFAYTIGATPPRQSISIGNTGAGTINWTASVNVPWLVISPSSGTAPSTPSILVNPAGLASGMYSGTISVSAAGFNSLVVQTNLTVSNGTSGPQVPPGSVVGAGLSTPPVSALSLNAIATAFGSSFAPPGTVKQVGPDDLVNGLLPTVVNGVCIFINNVAASIFALYSNQINFQVPQVPSTGTVGVQVATSCGTSNELRSPSQTVPVAETTPEFFYLVHNRDGKNPIAAVKALTGEYVGAPGLLPGKFVPAVPQDIITAYFTGGGITNPAYASGELPSDAASVSGAVAISIGGIQLSSSEILYAGVTPGAAGLYQVNMVVPAGVQPGNQPVILRIGSVASPTGYLFIGPSL